MGWDVATMTMDAMREAGADLITGPHSPKVLGLSEVPRIDAVTLNRRLQAATVQVVDLAWSRNYYEGHIPGAWYAIRARLAEDLAKLPATGAIVLTSPDGTLAELAAADLATGKLPVMALAGGTQAWVAAALTLEQGATNMASPAIDIRLKARELGKDIEQAMRDYLAWEINLVNDMADDDEHRFQVISG
jgi:hypothetical protein